MSRLLLLIDLQAAYFPGGAFPLVGPDAAVAAAARVLGAFREAGDPVVHVQHGETGPEAEFLREGSPGAELHPAVAPRDGEPVVTKRHPNAFRETKLAGLLRDAAPDELVVAGMMTSMCVDATVRAADDAGLRVTVVADACAAPDLELAGEVVPGAVAHTAFLAALAQGIATVTTSDELLAGARP